ncbi:4-hydroxy-tetrahydrodipicolinate reductase [bacterium]|nr:4-hydroxy-tetrahydrodipicolinate reductase [bacterium]
MKKIKLAINGAAGRMGRRLIALADGDERFEIVAAIESMEHELIGIDCGILAGIGKLGIQISEESTLFDVIIDFSTLEGIDRALEIALENKAAIVSGTTGLTPELLDKMTISGESIGVFYSPNFSKGISVLASMSAFLAHTLPEADIEIIEMHHRDKADAPSGTALNLGEKIAEARGEILEDIAVYGRKGHTGKRINRELGIHAVRGGGVIGEHKVIFSTPYESLTINHCALNRDLFVAGALQAAAFVFDKIGFFGMQDLIPT